MTDARFDPAHASAAIRGPSVFASLVGSAVGDALGLPYKNLSARRGRRMLGEPDRFRLIAGRGMVSDDAEHACMTAAAFATCGGDPTRFARLLARRLRWWLLTVPPGVGLATLKSVLKLWLGWPPDRAGVWSAGNGPAMRAAVLGRLCDANVLRVFIRASTRLTHHDPKAEYGALAVALASSSFADEARQAMRTLVKRLDTQLPMDDAADDLRRRLQDVASSVERGEATVDFAARSCRRPGRVSGYINETVPVALHAAFANADAMDAIRAAIRCGGDADSVASIVGGIRGVEDARTLARLMEWPCDAAWLRKLTTSAATGTTPPRFPTLLRVPRNLLLLAIVLGHVARRCLPPY